MRGLGLAVGSGGSRIRTCGIARVLRGRLSLANAAIFESSRGLKFVSVAVPSVQHAAAAALAIVEEHGARLAAELEAKRDRLCEGLERAGATVLRPAGPYFANADVRPLGYDDGGVTFRRELPERAGVVAIPTSVFCGDPERARSLVRFAFGKREEVIDEAAARLATLRRPHPTA